MAKQLKSIQYYKHSSKLKRFHENSQIFCRKEQDYQKTWKKFVIVYLRNIHVGDEKR